MTTPYRTNANQTSSVDAAGRQILTAEFPTNDVVVEFTYAVAGNITNTLTETIEGTPSPEGVEERSDPPGSWVAQSGEYKLQQKLDHAAKYGTLWINNDLGVPWHQIYSAEIKKRIGKAYCMRFVLKREYGD